MRTTAKLKDTLPWVKDGFPIRVIRRKKTQDGVKKYWDRARVVEVDGTKKYEFKRRDDGEILRMSKEDSNLLGDLEYFDRAYVIDRRKQFFEVFQNTEDDFHVVDFDYNEGGDSEDIQTDLAQNRNLYHQSVEQAAEDAVEIANPTDNRLTLAAGLFGIMFGTAVIMWVVMQGVPGQISSSVSEGVSKGVQEGLKEAGVASSILAVASRRKITELKERYL